MVEDRVVVAELHVVGADGLALVLLAIRISHDSNTSAMNIVRSRSGAGERKCRFCQIAPPTVLGMPT